MSEPVLRLLAARLSQIRKEMFQVRCRESVKATFDRSLAGVDDERS